MDDRPWCFRCAYHDRTWARRVGSLGTLAGLTTPVLAFFATRHTTSGLALGIWIGVACALPLLFVFVMRSAGRAGHDTTIRRRESGDAWPTDAGAPLHVGHRAVLARVARAAVPDASAAQTTVAVGIAFIATATALPAALKLPRWIEFEWVLLAWWAIAAAVLAALLYRGSRLVDDHELVFAWNAPAKGAGEQLSPAPTTEHRSSRNRSGEFLDAAGCLDPSGCLDGEGCAGVLVGLLLAGLACAAAWLLVELVAPVVFFLFYAAVLRAARGVTIRHANAKGHVGKSILWGVAWATVYVLPLSVVVTAVHATLRARGH